MPNNDIIELLDVLYGMVTEAWSVPLGNDKCIIEREKAVEIINEIKANLPTAIAEALRKNAEEQAHAMIEEQEVVRVARARSSEMIASAEAKSKELKRVASEYVDELMRQSEQSMSEALETIRRAQSSFQSLGGGIAQQPQPQQQASRQAQKQEQPVRQGQPPRPQQKSAAQRQAPQGRPDPISSKVQRIDREEEA